MTAIAAVTEAEQACITYNRNAMRRFVPVHNAADTLAPEPLAEEPRLSGYKAAGALPRSPPALRFPKPAGSPVKLFQQRVAHYQRKENSKAPPERAFAPDVDGVGGAHVGVQPRIADVSLQVAKREVDVKAAKSFPETAAALPAATDRPTDHKTAVSEKQEQKKPKARPNPSRAVLDRAAAAAHSFQNLLFHHRWALAAAALAGVLLCVPKSVVYGLLEKTAGKIRPRAAYLMNDDFRQGIAEQWGPGNLVLDPSGTARVEGLTLLADTTVLTDYRFDFDAKIASGAVGWVVGAQDADNYYAYKLEVSHKGNSATHRLVGFPVVNGEIDQERRITLAVPFELSDDFNRISVLFQEGRVTTLINGYGVDYRPEEVQASGGMGFFTEDGESALIRFVSVNSNEDFVGYALAGSLELIRAVQGLLES